jgi:hypothetical protein
MAVDAALEVSDVSITLVSDTAGQWRFASWMLRRGSVEEPLPPPPTDAAERQFADIEEAVAFFRLICPTPQVASRPAREPA